MSQLNVYVNVPAYLGEWLRNEFWNPETKRVEFPRGSAPRAILQSLLTRPPRGWFATRGDVSGCIPIEVPTFKGVNPHTYCHLSDRGKKALVSSIRKLFQSVLWRELSPLLEHDVQITDVIYAFLDNHGIDSTPQNWETVRQMYFRLRKRTLSKDADTDSDLKTQDLILKTGNRVNEC